MDERLEKAFQTANFMATLNLSRRTAFEEFKQGLIFYQNGCSFTADLETITKIHTLSLHNKSAIIIDNNNIPIEISDLSQFLEQCLILYKNESEKYLDKYNNIKKQRNISNLINL
jgi:hypothetical protein